MTTASHQETVDPQNAINLERSIPRPNKRHALIAGFVVAAIIVIAMIVVVGQQMLFAGHIYPGVRVQGIDVGAKTPSEAQTALESRLKLTSESALVLTYDGKTYTRKLSELGIAFDASATAQQALNFGRQGGIFQQVGNQLATLFSSSEVAPIYALDQPGLEQFIQEAATTINIPPIEASLKTSVAEIAITPSASGRRVDVQKTVALCRQAIDRGAPDKVTLVVEEIKPVIHESALQDARLTASKIISTPVELAFESKTWSISPEELAPMVTLTSVKDQEMRGAHWDATLNDAVLRKHLALVTKDIDMNAVDAKIVRNQAWFEVQPSRDGLVVDVDRAIADINKVVTNGSRRVTLQTTVAHPQILEAQLSDAAALATQMTSAPIALRYDGKNWSITREELAGMITFTSPTASSAAKPYLDEAAVTQRINAIARDIDQPAQDAQTTTKNNTLRLVAESKDGQAVKVPDVVAAVIAATESLNRTVDLKVEVQQPKLRIVANDLLAEANTSYAGSIAERAHNVILATETVNNTLIAPDEVLSLNTALGPVTLASGYQIGYGISVSGTEMITIPSEGGGICQVATTLFHAAFWTGLGIEERWPHMYWIERYGQPPLGMKGLDATVDQSGVDLKLKNNTGNWLVIKTRDDGLNVYFSIWGTNPHFDVKISNPVITNVVAASQEPVRQVDPTLAEGRELWVEHAENGFDAKIERWVSKDGKQIDHMIVSSHYRPSRNVLAVSKPKETPTPGPGTPGAGTPGPGTPTSGTPIPGSNGTPAQGASGTPNPGETPAPSGTPAPTPAP